MYGTHVGVDHAQFLIQIGGDKLAEQAKTRVVDHDLQFLALYGLVQQTAFLLVRHVRRDDAARHWKLCRQFAQAFLSAGAQDQLVAACRQQARHFASQSRGRTRDECFHANSLRFALIFIYYIVS